MRARYKDRIYRWAITVFWGSLGLAGCRGPHHASLDASAVVTVLPNLPWRIKLPRQARVDSREGGAVISLAPGSRYPHRLTLDPSPPAAPPQVDLSRNQTLADGMTLRYALSRSSGGSGGAEELLQGVITYGNQTFLVTCHDQQELFAPDATWCLALLATLHSL